MSAIPEAGRVIGVDWGATRVGVALTDLTQTIATPYAVWHRRRGKRPPLAEFLSLVETEQPVGLVVGLPYDDQGALADSGRAARSLGELFAQRSGLPIEWLDESFTTSETLTRLTQRGVAPRRRRHTVDAMAAAVLLEQWLAQRIPRR